MYPLDRKYIYVYREKQKCWTGPFTFIDIQGETVTVQLPTGRYIFRSTVVKPVVNFNLERISNLEKGINQRDEKEDPNLQSISRNHLAAMFGATNIKIMGERDARLFKEAREAEIKGLLQEGTFKIVKRASVPDGTRIYGTRFVDTVQSVNGVSSYKSRLISQNYNDKEATCISTKVPTIG